MRTLILTLTLLLTSFNIGISRVRYSSGIVKKRVDGDTLHILESRRQDESDFIKVRLICVDAPESDQRKWGALATKTIQRYLPVGSLVRLKIYSMDYYGRTLAEVFDQQGNNIALRMLDDGLSVLFKDRDRNACGKRYEEAEHKAKLSKKGVWSDRRFELPYKYRQRARKRKQRKKRKTQ